MSYTPHWSGLEPGDTVRITVDDAKVLDFVRGNVLRYTTLAGGKAVIHELHLGPGWPNHVVTKEQHQ